MTRLLPSTLEIHLFGPFRVTVDGVPVEARRWSRRGATLLVKLLALQPHHQLHREQAMELLWPELDPQAAANNLHKRAIELNPNYETAYHWYAYYGCN